MADKTGYTPKEIAGHIRDEHSTYALIMEDLIRAAGFGLERVHYSQRAYGDFLCVRDA